MTVSTASTADLDASVRQFYARHMQLLDDGKVEEWAACFTEDGIFATDAHPRPARGRDQIIAGARQVVAQLAEEGIVRRHWLGMSAIGREGETLRVRSYALVIQSSPGSGPSLRASTTCEDVLVPDGDSWLIRHRLVERDAPG